MSRNNGKNPKFDLKVNLPVPASSSRRVADSDDDSSSSSSSPEGSSSSSPSSCVSSDENPGSPSKKKKPPMVLTGCPRCLMYVMLSQEEPRCPKCKNPVKVDLLHGKKNRRS